VLRLTLKSLGGTTLLKC